MKLLSTNYSASAFNIGMLLLRVFSGGLMANHGYDKFLKFKTMQAGFMNFMGLGTRTSLGLVVFAEFFCAILLIIGLFTRIATIPLIFLVCVIIFKVSNADVFGKAELPALFLGAYLTILFIGPGKISIDGMLGK